MLQILNQYMFLSNQNNQSYIFRAESPLLLQLKYMIPNISFFEKIHLEQDMGWFLHFRLGV